MSFLVKSGVINLRSECDLALYDVHRLRIDIVKAKNCTIGGLKGKSVGKSTLK